MATARAAFRPKSQAQSCTSAEVAKFILFGLIMRVVSESQTAERPSGQPEAASREPGITGSVHVSGRQCGRVKGRYRHHRKVFAL